MLRVLVTGVNGFVGKHLARELKTRGHGVVGLGHDGAHDEVSGLLKRYEQCDLTNAAAVAKLEVSDIDAVISLAGLARVGDSFGAAETYKKVNVEVLSVLGKRLIEVGSKARVIAVSTGAVYGPHQSMPLTETPKTVEDGSPYALSKLLMEEAAHELRKGGLDCVIARPFNHIGPGQATGFLVPDLYQKLLGAQKTGKPLRVGNLNTKRDYTDVRDVARAYADLAASETLEFDLYNVCTGRSRSGQEILDLLLKEMKLSDKVEVEVDPAFIRPNDPADLHGSHDRLTEETGWEPAIPLETTIRDFVKAQGA